MKQFTYGIKLAAFAAVFFGFGATVQAADLPKDANTTCPVMMEEKVDPDLFVEYKGDRVYVCCNKCKRQFMKDPDKYIARIKAEKKATAMEKSRQLPKK